MEEDSLRSMVADHTDEARLAVDLMLHMVPVNGGSPADQLADSNSDHEMLNS